MQRNQNVRDLLIKLQINNFRIRSNTVHRYNSSQKLSARSIVFSDIMLIRLREIQMNCGKFFGQLIFLLAIGVACKPRDTKNVANMNKNSLSERLNSNFVTNHHEKYGKPYSHNIRNLRSVVFIDNQTQNVLHLNNGKALINGLDILKANTKKTEFPSIVENAVLQKKWPGLGPTTKKSNAEITLYNDISKQHHMGFGNVSNKQSLIQLKKSIKEQLNGGDFISIAHNGKNTSILKSLGISEKSLEFDVKVIKAPKSSKTKYRKLIVITRKPVIEIDLPPKMALEILPERFRDFPVGKKSALVFESGSVKSSDISERLGPDFEVVAYNGKAPGNKDIFIIEKKMHPSEADLRSQSNEFFHKNWDSNFCGLDGCFAKANALVQNFSDKGVPMEKLFILNPPEKFGWRYHVAAVASYKDSQGSIRKMVIDPMLGKEGDSPAKWMGKMDPETLDGAEALAKTSKDEFSITVTGTVKLSTPKEFSLSRIQKHNDGKSTVTVYFKREANFNEPLFIKNNLDRAHEVNVAALRAKNLDKSSFSDPEYLLVDP